MEHEANVVNKTKKNGFISRFRASAHGIWTSFMKRVIRLGRKRLIELATGRQWENLLTYSLSMKCVYIGTDKKLQDFDQYRQSVHHSRVALILKQVAHTTFGNDWHMHTPFGSPVLLTGSSAQSIGDDLPKNVRSFFFFFPFLLPRPTLFYCVHPWIVANTREEFFFIFKGGL